MIANNEDRRDIAQDVYLRVFHKLGSFKFQSMLSTWVWQIAFNTCSNYLQKKKLIPFVQAKPVYERDDGSTNLVLQRALFYFICFISTAFLGGTIYFFGSRLLNLFVGKGSVSLFAFTMVAYGLYIFLLIEKYQEFQGKVK